MIPVTFSPWQSTVVISLPITYSINHPSLSPDILPLIKESFSSIIYYETKLLIVRIIRYFTFLDDSSETKI